MIKSKPVWLEIRNCSPRVVCTDSEKSSSGALRLRRTIFAKFCLEGSFTAAAMDIDLI